jgi:hypothetical protein
MSYCAQTNNFAGGTIQMVQTWNGHFDVDRGCPDRIPALASTGADGSVRAPFPLRDRADGTLAPSQGGQSVDYTLANAAVGA